MNFQKYRPTITVDLPNRQWPNKRLTKAPIWASVDLRDGNQALAHPMSVTQKLQLWQKLVNIGFKTIEIGFPSASSEEFEFTRQLIEKNLIPDDVTVQVLVQAREHLIEKTYESLIGVKQAIVHVYNSTSTIQRDKVFHKSKDEIKAMAVQGAKWVQEHAKSYPDTKWQFQYSPESFSQTEANYAIEVCQAVMEVWQPTPENPCILNLPATVEVSSPNRFADQIENFINKLPNRDCAIISLHTHNDRGCAVAASELGLLAGADRVEGTLLGNGERTGNMDIVTLAMNLFSEGIDPELDLSNPEDWIPTLEDVTDIKTHIRHPWVGEAVYTAYSGSHQDAIRKSINDKEEDGSWKVAYLPIDPQDIGRNYEAIIRVNSQSGKAGSAFILEQEYGLNLPKWVTQDFAHVAQQCAEKNKGIVSHKELFTAFKQHYKIETNENKVISYQVNRQDDKDILTIEINDKTLVGEGNGTLSSLCNALQKHFNKSLDVLDYSEHAMKQGKDAKAIAYVHMQINGKKNVGIAKAEDTVTAQVLAVLSTCGTL